MNPSVTPPDTLVVLGPTASGKTRLGVALAREFGGEIISADSRQVYRELEIGCGKDRDEYTEGGPAVPVHLLDVCGLDEEYSVFKYQRDCFAALTQIRSRDALPVIVGGTGLYLEAVLAGYRMVEAPENPSLRDALSSLDNEALKAKLHALRPTLHNTTDTDSRERLVRAIEIAEHAQTHPPDSAPPVSPFILGVRWSRDVLHSRIRERLRDRMNAGLIEEVRGLMDAGVTPERLCLLGLEYRYVTDFITGAIQNKNDLVQKLCAAINQFAKRQETWFRRMERQGLTIHWIDGGDHEAAIAVVREANLPSLRH
jgi:tRNA dimethylallyltransferase